MCFFCKRVLPCLSVFFVGFKFSMGLVWNLDSSWVYSLAFLASACFSWSSKSVLEFKIRSFSSLRPKRKNCADLNGSHQNCSNWFWTPTRVVSYNVCFDGIDFQSDFSWSSQSVLEFKINWSGALSRQKMKHLKIKKIYIIESFWVPDFLTLVGVQNQFEQFWWLPVIIFISNWLAPFSSRENVVKEIWTPNVWKGLDLRTGWVIQSRVGKG